MCAWPCPNTVFVYFWRHFPAVWNPCLEYVIIHVTPIAPISVTDSKKNTLRITFQKNPINAVAYSIFGDVFPQSGIRNPGLVSVIIYVIPIAVISVTNSIKKTHSQITNYVSKEPNAMNAVAYSIFWIVSQ